jgi:hypothetical protein
MRFSLEELSEVNVTEDEQVGIREVQDDIYSGATSGRKSKRNNHVGNHPANQIPSDIYGPCYPQLYTYIYDKDSFDKRIFDSLNLALDPKQCYGTCKYIYIYTTQWIPSVLEKYSALISVAKRENIHIRFHVFIGHRTRSFELYL